VLRFGNNICCLFAISVGCMVLIGCNGSSTSSPPAGSIQQTGLPPSSPDSASSDNRVDGQTSSTIQPQTLASRSESNRAEWSNVFFPDPLAIAAEGVSAQEVNGQTETDHKNIGSIPSEGDQPETRSTEANSDQGRISWSNCLSDDVLQNEVKRVRNQITVSTKGLGAYNKECQSLSWEATLLSGLAGIAIEAPFESSWKANAHYVRDFSVELATASSGPGRENYEKARTAAEKLASVLSGSIPADAGDVSRHRPYHETADRTGLMKRIERAYEWLRLNVNTPSKLKSEFEMIVQEASIISALGTVVSTSGYSSADESDYQMYVKNLIDGGKEAKSAAIEQNYEKFTQSIGKVGKSCADCHPKYAQ